ncbi:MAG: serine/threonine-protein kinase [Planctomycetota bacterium]|nr:MAG: serine/threonine-protein kinase [Planctomycetota bacterium]
MTLSAAEIELGRLAIERGIATREQVRSCAELRSAGNGQHLARMLVDRGILDSSAARALWGEAQRRSGSRPGSALRSGNGGSDPGGRVAVCSACGYRWPAPAVRTEGPLRCPGCGGSVLPPPLPVPSGAHDTRAGSAFRGAGGPGRTQVVDQDYSYTDARGAGPAGSNGVRRGPHGTHAGPVGSGAFGQQGSAFGQQGSAFGQQGSAFGQQGSAFGAPVSDAAFAAAAEAEFPPNLAPDDPIAHAMTTRRNPDGSVETVFGPYDIIGEIARGGMGIVYRARQRSLKRIVALKVMKEGENASEKQIRRFKRETEAAAKLQHPNIVAVHEVGCHEGFHYFTMDLIEGDPLDAIVKRKEKLPVERVLTIVQEVAHAIHYAHGKGIIHRDLKPANVLLDTDGHPKVTDFGLAKQIDHKSMLTRTGAVVGTPFYMPPEQARGDVDIDQRADVYALGVILYELLTLKLPFHGETTMEVYHKILEEEPIPPRKHDSRIDKDVNTIVLKAMEKDLARRYQTAQELAEDIERYLQGDPIKARPLGPIGRAIKKAKKNMPVVVISTITALALSGSLGLLYWKHRERIRVEEEINRDHEWTSFKNDVGQKRAGAQSHINSAVARLRERDPQGALADLDEALRSLEELPLLAQDANYTRWNTVERNQGYLDQEKERTEAIYQRIYLEMGKAHAVQGTPEALARAQELFQEGLAHASTKTEPGALLLRLEVGRTYAAQGNYEKALSTLAEILAQAPDHMETRLALGRVHAQAGEPLKALEAFTQVIETEVKAVRAYLARGETNMLLGRYDDALRDFGKALDLDDDSFEGYVWRGRAHQALGHYTEAQEDLTEAIDITPSLPDGYYYRAELHFAQGKYQQAAKDYEVAISRSAQFYPAYVGLGRAQERMLQYDRARQQYEDVVSSEEPEALAAKAEALAALASLDLALSDPVECRAEIRRGRAAGRQGAGTAASEEEAAKAEALAKQRRGEAARRYDEALAQAPGFLPALVGRARVALLEGDAAAARAPLQRALEVLAERPSIKFPAEESAASSEDEWEDDDWDDDEGATASPAAGDEPLAEVQALLGHSYLLGAEPDASAREAARKAFDAALAADARSLAAKAGLARLALLAGDEERARELFAAAREASALGVGEAGFFYLEGLRFEGLAQRSKKPEYFQQARLALARAAVLEPWNASALHARARLCVDWENNADALALAGRAVAADPFLREAYELRGFVFTDALPPVGKGAGGPERDPARGQKEFERAIAVAEQPAEAAHAHYGRARALLAQTDGRDDGTRLREAQRDLREAVRTIPSGQELLAADPEHINNAKAYLRLSAEVARRLGDAAAERQAATRLEAVESAAREAAKRELGAGRALRDRLNYSEAIKHFDRATQLNPGYSDAYYERGTCYLKIGNFVPGILDFSRALELDPRIADQVYNKVYQISYVVDLNRVITELNKIVSDHPNESYVVFLRGFFYVAKTEFKQVGREDLERGIADFDRTLELNPKHVTAYLYRGFLWFKMAGLQAQLDEKKPYYEKAMRDYRKALELDPQSGISHYLQALCWSVRSGDEGIDEDTREDYRRRSLDALESSFKTTFKGYERIRNEKGFDPVRKLPRFKELMRGK